MGQFGFIKGRSTQSELLAHYKYIDEAISEGKRTDTIFLDFAKAFDNVDHEILLEKMKNMQRWKDGLKNLSKIENSEDHSVV